MELLIFSQSLFLRFDYATILIQFNDNSKSYLTRINLF